MKPLTILWQRLVKEGQTCDRCGGTQLELRPDIDSIEALSTEREALWTRVDKATFLALCGSFMVSYTRARAESLGLAAKVGIMQRPERIVFLGMGALIHPIALKIVIWMVALFANFTALQRLRFAFKQDAPPSKPEPTAAPDLKSIPISKGNACR